MSFFVILTYFTDLDLQQQILYPISVLSYSANLFLSQARLCNMAVRVIFEAECCPWFAEICLLIVLTIFQCHGTRISTTSCVVVFSTKVFLFSRVVIKKLEKASIFFSL